MRQIIAAAIVLLMLLFLPPWLRAEENTPETDAALQPLQTEQPNPASGAGSDAAHTCKRQKTFFINLPDGGGVPARRGAGRDARHL